MNPIMLDFGFIQIRWYSFFIFLAMLLGSTLVYLETKKKKINQNDFENMVFYGLLIGVLGARIYYVLFNLNEYLQAPLEILKIWNGGLAIHGGIIATGIFILFYTKKKNMNLLVVLDCIAVGLILAQAIGRWGNFFNGEAYGRIVSLEYLKNLHLPQFIIKGMLINGSYREPTFLYESIASLIGFIVMLLKRTIKKLKVGQLSGFYLVWYGVVRYIIEGHRADSLMLGPLRVAQIISILFGCIGILLILINRKNKKTYQESTIYN